VAVEREIEIRNPQGLHARPASIFVRIANKFISDITVSKASEKVNGKSIMGIMMLAANQGTVIKMEIAGPDENEAMDELATFLSKDTEPGELEV